MAEKRFFPEIVLDKTSLIPLRVQLESKLRRSILDERPLPGTRMISERTLAGILGVNRDTVHYAYEVLAKEKLLNISPLRGGKPNRRQSRIQIKYNHSNHFYHPLVYSNILSFYHIFSKRFFLQDYLYVCIMYFVRRHKYVYIFM